MTFYQEHSKVWVSVDVIIFGFDKNTLKVLVGRRQMDPGRGQWSLYGGFVGDNESLDEAATRTVEHLTGMSHLYMQQVGAYGNVDRDPGERVISVAYYALINVSDYDEHLRREHGVEWMAIDQLPELYGDHQQMVANAAEMIKTKAKVAPIGFNLLPDLFTLTQLQHLYEAIFGMEVDKRNFRKRIKEFRFIEKTELIDKLSSKRGAALYRFNKKIYNEKPFFKL